MKYLLSFLVFLTAISSRAQVYVADQALLHVAPNGIVFIDNGDLENDGTISLEGEIDLNGSLINHDLVDAALLNEPKMSVSGNWTNNGTFTSGFSRVTLDGAAQTIGGTSQSDFYKLDLQGAAGDIKTLTFNIGVKNQLNLANCMLDVSSFKLSLSDVGSAILESGGFIHTAFGGNVELLASAIPNQNFIIPFGYVNSSTHKRRLSFFLDKTGNFKAALIGGDPTTYGMPPAALQDSICRINDDYVWQLETDQQIEVGFEQDASEAMFTRLSHWAGPQWEQTSSTALNPNPGFVHMSTLNPAGGLHSYNFSSEAPFIDLEDDFEVFKDIKRTISYTGFVPTGGTISWMPMDQLTCADCLPSTFLSEYSDVITVRVSNDICDAEDQVSITVNEQPDVFIQNAFSPTKDNLNEIFIPTLASFETLVSIKIFNRWGEKIYEGIDGWDGTYKGDLVPQGMYLYEIEIDRAYSPTDTRTKFSRGTVMLMR